MWELKNYTATSKSFFLAKPVKSKCVRCDCATCQDQVIHPPPDLPGENKRKGTKREECLYQEQ